MGRVVMATGSFGGQTVAEQALRELDEAMARAMGDGGEAGPVYVEFPTDVLRESVPPALVLEEHPRPKPPRVLMPEPGAVAAAVETLWAARRPLVVTGRGARRRWRSRSGRSSRSTATGRSGSTRWRSTRRPATGRGRCSWSTNNAAWNIERYDQEVNYGGRVVGTELRWSDYAAMARAFGARGERVEDPDELPAALERAFANAPALLDVVVSRDAVSSDANKGLGYVPDYQPLTAWDEAERARRSRPSEG